jgi:hypothetical protein
MTNRHPGDHRMTDREAIESLEARLADIRRDLTDMPAVKIASRWHMDRLLALQTASRQLERLLLATPSAN